MHKLMGFYMEVLVQSWFLLLLAVSYRVYSVKLFPKDI